MASVIFSAKSNANRWIAHVFLHIWWSNQNHTTNIAAFRKILIMYPRRMRFECNRMRRSGWLSCPGHCGSDFEFFDQIFFLHVQKCIYNTYNPKFQNSSFESRNRKSHAFGYFIIKFAFNMVFEFLKMDNYITIYDFFNMAQNSESGFFSIKSRFRHNFDKI